MDQPRLCIAVEHYHKPGQTFVNRHIQHMMGGNSCLYVHRWTGENPFDKAVFNVKGDHGALTWATRPVARFVNKRRLGTGRVPHGAARANFARFLRAQRVEAVLAEFGTEALAVHETAQALDLPCFTYFRGSDASQSLSMSSRVRAYRRVIPTLTGVFSVSRFLLDHLAAHGIANDNAHVIPSGVDVRRFRPGTKRPESFLAVGRMVDKKAPLITLRAFAAASADRPGATLRFIGGGPLEDPARALAAELGVADKVRFDGTQPHEVVREALAETGVFLQHSLVGKGGNTEGLPTSIQEALAAGCLVISTEHAGIPEAVAHGRNGWLCAEGDEAAYTDLIRRSLTAGTGAMQDAARRTAEDRFDNDKLLARTEDLIREGIARHRAA